MSIGTRIKERREQLGLSRNELASKIGVTPSAIANYENEISKPKIELMYRLFESLKCDANYLHQDDMNALLYKDTATTEEFENLVKKYRSLDDFGRKSVDIVLEREFDRVKKIEELASRIAELEALEEHPATVIEIPTKETGYPMRLIGYYRSASAGSGIFILGNEDMEELRIPDTPKNRDVDFAINVDGDSMEPDFHDGDIALVSKKAEIFYGDVGIFIVDGNSYIKEYGKTELISRNPESPNIRISEYSNIVCMGKVIGKL